MRTPFSPVRTLVVVCAALLFPLTALALPVQAPAATTLGLMAEAEAENRSVLPADVLGNQKVVVIRVTFADYPMTSTYSQAQVQGFFDNEINTMWRSIAYGNISISATVTALVQLPDPRSSYVNDYSGGDLSDGGKFSKVIRHAISAAGTAVSYLDVQAVIVIMAETNASQFHRGQGGKCSPPIGAGVWLLRVGCVVVSENPGMPVSTTWGRWMHEMGHAFQQPRTLHPSAYQNSFELMDRLYPGHSGMYEKQNGVRGFHGWIDPSVYKVIPTGSLGDTAVVYAEEYQPGEVPGAAYRAIKVMLTSHIYYLVSVRAPFNGDEVRPIPDPGGVLIERVIDGANPPVTVISSSPPPSQTLWHVGQIFSSTADSLSIGVILKPAPSTEAYLIQVQRSLVPQPDVMIRPWLSPPLNTYETTDIWVDSICNGYGVYALGTSIPVSDSDAAGIGNGDPPCANNENRVYARVRNLGTSAATGVVVRFEVTDPLGVGIQGANGWASIGTVTAADFPALSSLAAGAYADVYVPWTPALTPTPEQIATGQFNAHTCLRVRMDALSGEGNTANQDGRDEQENLTVFAVAPYTAAVQAPPTTFYVRLLNDSALVSKTYDLVWEHSFPPTWTVLVNNDVPSVDLAPNAAVSVPVVVAPFGPAIPGQAYSFTLAAQWLKPLTSTLDPTDIHYEYEELSGMTAQFLVAEPSSFYLDPTRQPTGVDVAGHLATGPGNVSTQVRVNLLDLNRIVVAGQNGNVNASGFFDVFFADNAQVAKARYAAVIYLGQFTKGVYRQPAYAEALIARGRAYLPLIVR